MPTLDRFNSFQKAMDNKRPKAPSVIPQGQNIGQQRADNIKGRVDLGNDIYSTNRSKSINRLAQDLVEKSAGHVPMDEFGLVKKQLTDLTPQFRKQIEVVGRTGDIATAAAEAKQRWHRLKEIQDLAAYSFQGQIQVNGGLIPGAKADNPGAKAVALAMKAKANHTPYVWGGNSLSRGVDCSGLVQQVYRQLGIEVPRTTYQQAKHGKRVSLKNLRPGDLVFYRNLGHVGLYMGNGKVVHAANSRLDIIVSNLYNSNGAPDMAIRPY